MRQRLEPSRREQLPYLYRSYYLNLCQRALDVPGGRRQTNFHFEEHDILISMTGSRRRAPPTVKRSHTPEPLVHGGDWLRHYRTLSLGRPIGKRGAYHIRWPERLCPTDNSTLHRA